MPRVVHFEIHASVVFQLGESLITDSVQALTELVKNSYDADASYCKVPCFGYSFRTQVHIQILVSILQFQGIVGDSPAVRDQRLNHGVVVNVPGRHSLLTR